MWPWPSIILSAACVALLWLGVGDSLGLWLGGFAIVALLLPPMAVRRRSLVHRVFDAGAVADCIALAWLGAMIFGDARFVGWLQSSIVLYSFALAGFGAVMMLTALRVPELLASTLVVTALLGWLGAPVLLSPWMSQSLARVLSGFHPLLAVNGQLTQLGIWLEQPIVYRHTVLGQDLPYSLPANVWICAAGHALIGAMGLAVAWATARRPTPQG